MSSHTTFAAFLLPRARSTSPCLLCVLCFIAAIGCGGDSPTAPTGSLQVEILTNGEYPDVDGYSLSVSGEQSRQVGTGETVNISDLSVGTYSVSISGIAAPCELLGLSSREIEITERNTVAVRFEVDCLKQPNECTFDLKFGSSGGLTPEFTWNPVCRVVYLTIADIDAATDEVLRWRVIGPPFLGPIQYGVAPPGTTVENGPLPLTPGHKIVASAEFYLNSGSLFIEVVNWTP